jgi:uncharacterized protein (TIGR03067 family)
MGFRFLLFSLVVTGTTAQGQESPPVDGGLNGTWEITAMIDNGELIPETKISAGWVQNSRVYISGQMFSFIRPTTQQRRDLLFVINPNSNPKTFDVAGSLERTGAKGIYQLDGQSLFLCMAGPERQERPREFAAPLGSQNILMILKKVDPRPLMPPTPQWTPAAAPVPPPNPDGNYRSMLIGNWGHQDEEKVEMITFNSDGSFSMTRTWKKGFQRVFHEDVRSSGVWKVQNGIIILTITASTEADLRNQVYSYRIRSISASDVVYINQQGQVRREWRVP